MVTVVPLRAIIVVQAGILKSGWRRFCQRLRHVERKGGFEASVGATVDQRTASSRVCLQRVEQGMQASDRGDKFAATQRPDSPIGVDDVAPASARMAYSR